MTVYLDTSSLVKLYLNEPDSEAVAQLVEQADVVVTSVLSYPEARATFTRRVRERLLSSADSAILARQFDQDWEKLVVITLGDELARAAGRLAHRHGVRGGDAVHLASFEELLARCEDTDIRFSGADDRLVRAAESLG